MDDSILGRVSQQQDLLKYKELHWEGSFENYLGLLKARPGLFRSAFQYVRDMILSYGIKEYTQYREKLVHYNFFDDPFENGKDALYGLDRSLMQLVDKFKAGAEKHGAEKRILLLHGPVGTAKSTIARLIKKGLEAWCQTDEGQLYTFAWRFQDREPEDCPMHEEPLKLVPQPLRGAMQVELSLPYPIEGDLCPVCQYNMDYYLSVCGGDWAKVMENILIKRLVFSEKKRIGIGTFQPRDEKNQDSTELTGDINYRKVAIFGSDSDPRAFNFDGELNIANRGVIEFIEVLKLETAFLYDLLTASQERKLKPRKFAHTDVDLVILSHTNGPEFKALQDNQKMQAFLDRTVRVDVPYNLRLSEEMKIYTRDYNPQRVRHKHIAPHTLEVAAMWAVTSRLDEPKDPKLTLIQKMQLYDGKLLPGFTDDNIIEIRAEHPQEGLEKGISPRYIQDVLSNVLVSQEGGKCVSPFLLMRELERYLGLHSLVTNEKLRDHYKSLLPLVQAELDEILKNEVQRAIASDEEQAKRLCCNYVDSVKAYIQKQKVRDPITGKDVPPDENLMRSVEEKIDIPESRKDDFRRELMNFIAVLSLDGKTFDWKANDRLRRAIELKLFEDQKHSIKLNSLVSQVIDPEAQKKIDVIKGRMIDQMGYCDQCATDVLTYVASIFVRGDLKEEKK